jgi:hypothetical protein
MDIAEIDAFLEEAKDPFRPGSAVGKGPPNELSAIWNIADAARFVTTPANAKKHVSLCNDRMPRVFLARMMHQFELR